MKALNLLPAEANLPCSQLSSTTRCGLWTDIHPSSSLGELQLSSLLAKLPIRSLTLPRSSQYHAILILLYRPPLVYPRTNAADLSLADRLAVVNNSSLAIGSILSGADVSSNDFLLASSRKLIVSQQFVDPMVYVASPFVNHCFFLASSAWIQGAHFAALDDGRLAF